MIFDETIVNNVADHRVKQHHNKNEIQYFCVTSRRKCLSTNDFLQKEKKKKQDAGRD